MTRSIALVLTLAGCGASKERAPTPAMQVTAPSPIVDNGTIRSRFRDCGNEFVGQVLDAPGVTCRAVCTTYGYPHCRGRAGQSSFNACRDKQAVVGPCDQPFEAGWSSQCDCTSEALQMP